MRCWAMACRWSCVVLLLAVLSPACGSRGAESPASLAPGLICQGSRPDLIEGKETGLAICSNGMRHRPKAETCPSFLPRADNGVASLKQTAAKVVWDFSPEERAKWSWCLGDSDCSARPHGHCEASSGVGSHCEYGCLSDAECSKGELCLCDEPVGYCVPASCRTDADCASPFVCGDYEPVGAECGRRDAFACQTAGDECAVECRSPDIFCTFLQGRRTCGSDCAIY
jgi:hypothetical protein